MRKPVIAAAAALFAAAVLLAGCGGSDDRAATSESAAATRGPTEEDRQATAWEACTEEATGQLKAPATAVFPDESEAVFEVPSTTRVEVASYVDSQNGFGALIRTGWSCKVQLFGDGRLRNVSVDFDD